MGGLIVKRMLIQCDATKHPHLAHRRAISISTYGLLFLGTPHAAIDMECFDIPDTFDVNSVDNINSLFCEMMASYRIYFFWGTKALEMNDRRLLVSAASAAPYGEVGLGWGSLRL